MAASAYNLCVLTALMNAAATLKDFLTQRPGFTNGYLWLARIYGERGDRPEAEAVLLRAQQVESLSPRGSGPGGRFAAEIKPAVGIH